MLLPLPEGWGWEEINCLTMSVWHFLDLRLNFEFHHPLYLQESNINDSLSLFLNVNTWMISLL